MEENQGVMSLAKLLANASASFRMAAMARHCNHVGGEKCVPGDGIRLNG